MCAKVTVEVNGAPVALHDFAKSNGSPRSDHLVMPSGPSMTRQEFAAECDINSIMDHYDQYLSDPMRSIREPVYYDFTEMPDSLMGAMEVLHRGEQAFMTLPAVVRKEFDNSAAMFVDFAADPANIEQLREWGLAKPEEAPVAPMKVEVVNQVSQATGAEPGSQGPADPPRTPPAAAPGPAKAGPGRRATHEST